MKLPDLSEVYDYADRTETRAIAHVRVAFPPIEKRQRPDCIILELNTQAACAPVYASPYYLRCPTQNSGPSGSLLLFVGLLHSLLHAALPRRTALVDLIR
jgi:hypothetical protein